MAGALDTGRQGLVNRGGFFSPYYLFDLLSRQHAGELDPEVREANRRLLRRPFRAAWARYGEGISTAGEAWPAWHRELLTALGFVGEDGKTGDPTRSPLRRFEAPVETIR